MVAQAIKSTKEAKDRRYSCNMATKKTQKKAPRKTATQKIAAPKRHSPAKRVAPYGSVLREFSQLVEGARHASARAVNALMTASYWEIGRRIVQHEQGGKHRAGYGEELITRLSVDLTERFGRGFSKRNIEQMRAFYLSWPIAQTLSAQLEEGDPSGKKRIGRGQKTQTVSAQLNKTRSVGARAQQIVHLHAVSKASPLPWSHYVRLLTVEDDKARAFYEKEALRNGWTVRQLDRQVATRFL